MCNRCNVKKKLFFSNQGHKIVFKGRLWSIGATFRNGSLRTPVRTVFTSSPSENSSNWKKYTRICVYLRRLGTLRRARKRCYFCIRFWRTPRATTCQSTPTDPAAPHWQRRRLRSAITTHTHTHTHTENMRACVFRMFRFLWNQSRSKGEATEAFASGVIATGALNLGRFLC